MLFLLNHSNNVVNNAVCAKPAHKWYQWVLYTVQCTCIVNIWLQS